MSGTHNLFTCILRSKFPANHIPEAQQMLAESMGGSSIIVSSFQCPLQVLAIKLVEKKYKVLHSP